MVTFYRQFLIVILACLALFSQAQVLHITGQVIDGQNGQGLRNVNISLAMSTFGAVSGTGGDFDLVTDTLPANLVFSHIGYKTKRVWVEKDVRDLVVILDPDVKMLQEVEVLDKTVAYPFFKDEKYSVMDYEVDQDLIYLLIYKFRKSRSELLCKTLSGDTLVPACPIHFKPTGLFLDCLGYLHILSKDSIYQVYLGRDSIQLTHRYSLDRFHDRLENCVASSDNYLYFKKKSPDKLRVDFIKIDRKTHKKEYIASAQDDVMLNVLRDNPADYYYLLNESIPDGRESFVDYAWVRKILYKPNAAVMVRLGDSLCVFNTANGSLEIYNLDGQLFSEGVIPLALRDQRIWSKEIYVDSKTGLVYTSFLKNGVATLFWIDVSSYVRYRVMDISHPFPEKIRVHGDYLFYMYDVSGEGDNKMLFKQKL